MSQSHTPFIPDDHRISEVSFASVGLGLVLAIILTAANTYLGLYAGMTVGASIPAAVLSMGILRGVFRTGNILENNIVQTIASTGESLAAGIIFTVPALLLTGAWTEIEYWPTTLICMTGGILGILFMIPLRRSHIIEDQSLTFPEGVACAEILKAGESEGTSVKPMFLAILYGGVFKFFMGGVALFKGTLEWAFSLGSLGVYFGSDMSVALLGVGYIIGANIASLVFIGGTLGWLVALPFLSLGSDMGPDVMDWFWTQWSTKVRYLGVGAMIVGGIASLIGIRHGIVSGIREAISGYRTQSHSPIYRRTEVNMNGKHILLLLITTLIVTFLVLESVIQNYGVTIVSTLSVLVLSFFFVAVASYIVGLVGSSNSPVSGMTICAVLASGGLLIVLGMTGQTAIIATLAVAGVVCCAICSSGDISQDLKTGYLLGATPKKQQWMEIVGAIASSFVIAPVLTVLHSAYGIGTGAPNALKAPQATLFASLAQGLFGGGSIPWHYVEAGAVLGLVILFIDHLLKKRQSRFRMPLMAVAVGIYLPLTLSVPIGLGGLIAALSPAKSGEGSAGTLFASGLIAGEALMGVVIGVCIYFGRDFFPISILGKGELSEILMTVFTIIAFGFICRRLYKPAS